MTNVFYFYRKDIGDGLKYLGTLERVGEVDYRFTYCENPVLLVGKPQLPHRDTPCTTKEDQAGNQAPEPATGLPWVLADRSSEAGNKVGPAPCNSPPLGICIPGAAPRGNCVALMPCGA